MTASPAPKVNAAPPAALRWRAAALFLLLLIPLSALVSVHSAHRNRQMFVHLESLRADENRLQEEWRRLLLERSALAAHARVEQLASTRLGMRSLGNVSQVLVQ